MSAMHDYLSPALLAALRETQVPVAGVPGLTVDPGLLAAFPDLQTPEVLALLVEVYREVKPTLDAVLAQRTTDKAFSDRATRALREKNKGLDYLSADYQTVIGARDARGRVVVGPQAERITQRPAVLPAFLDSPAVTLFGPPDSAKMCVNAMNAVHRARRGEPGIVGELVDASGLIPMWGADSEDSKTPFVADLLAATDNLRGCYRRDLAFTDPRTGKDYVLAPEKLSVPIKRVPGLALPDGLHQVDGEPLPLHLVDLVLHAAANHDCPEALVFYVPKLENEEEAAYLATLVRVMEEKLAARHIHFQVGTVRLFIVFETARAIFRIREMSEALYPYFAGGSLGWHDFLASTARLFRHDPNYRIPVKADPNIVIHHIKESHLRLAKSVPEGAIRIGGMYGTLFEDGNPASFQVSMVGYVRDVVTQLRRGLNGFWVAHPDFVRVGIALVEAWQRRLADPADSALVDLITALVPDAVERDPLLAFVMRDEDVESGAEDPLHLRRVLAADIVESAVISNSDPEEVRYNVFQAIQYLAAWLSGTGCVALPATMTNQRGEEVFVRVMDDLATTERSRWELWAEVHHGRVTRAAFEAILAEELAFVRNGADTSTKRVQVRWEGEAARWYPIAERILRTLVTDPEPVEAVTELLLPFTMAPIRESEDPWATAARLCPGRFS